MRFNNGGNEIVIPLYGRKWSCEEKVRRIQGIMYFIQNNRVTSSKIHGRTIPLDKLTTRRSIIPRMFQKDMYLG